MAKVSLRLYTREIENLIDGGQIEEAISHCKYILQSYPKHIETYRLLGKAYLESQHYGEAADIFQRVLSSIPDDFVTHVAMSIIKEDEGNLDEAIWHMERAYEVQPSNNALQEELRRLLGRRDRTEPEKVRLTRGALARMYAKGNLFQQAIAETRGMLADEPGRIDLQVLLAQMCFQAGKRIEATEICSSLLSKYPFCYEANLILSKILPETTRADDAIVYSQRIIAMDPYAAYLDKSHPDLNDVPDNAVMIERLDFIPGSSPEINQPEWASSLGIDMQSTPTTINNDDLPSWLTGIDESTDISDSIPETIIEENLPAKESKEENLIPDWMRSAGWDQSDHQGEEALATEPNELNEEPPASLEEAAPADLPDWIREMAPETSSSAEAPEEISPDLPDWISKLEDENIPADETSANLSDSDVPEWLKDIDKMPVQTIEDKPEVPSNTLGGTKMLEPSSDSSDTSFNWLKELKEEASEKAVAPVESATAHAETFDEPTPETTVEAQPQVDLVTPVASGLPEWLIGLDYTPEDNLQPSVEALDINEPIPVTPEVDERVVMEDMAAQEARPSNPMLTSLLNLDQGDDQDALPNLEEQDDAFAWLENLAAKQGADEETLFVQPEDRKATPPAWIRESDLEQPIETINEEQPEEEEEELPLASLEDIFADEQPSEISALNVVQKPGTTMPLTSDEELFDQYAVKNEEIAEVEEELVEDTLPQPVSGQALNQDDTDAALAWLESLAAKQGADEETLFVRPEDRAENPPEWVQQFDDFSVSETNFEAAPNQVESNEISSPVESVNDTRVDAVRPSEDALPDWLQGFEETQGTEMEEESTSIAPAWYEPVSEDSQEEAVPEGVGAQPSEEFVDQIAPVQVTDEIAPSTVESETGIIETSDQQKLFEDSQKAISDGKIETAIAGYSQLVQNGLYLEETIHDLRDALYHFPIDLSIWQTLGDAYMRSNRLQDALDAFAKAEDLIR